ncbi:MAG: phosphatase PAP2 family protein [Hyphomicrobiales bacterium]
MSLNVEIYTALQGIRTPGLDNALVAITELGDPVVTTSIWFAVTVFLITQKAIRTAVFWTLAVGGSALANSLTKIIVHEARPVDLSYAGFSAYSFPSGHATVNAAVYLTLALIVGRSLPWRGKAVAFVCAAAMVASITFSRLYLGAHWMTDVAGSFVLVGLWLSLLTMTLALDEAIALRRLLALVLLVLLAVGGVHIGLHHGSDVERYSNRISADSPNSNGAPDR